MLRINKKSEVVIEIDDKGNMKLARKYRPESLRETSTIPSGELLISFKGIPFLGTTPEEVKFKALIIQGKVSHTGLQIINPSKQVVTTLNPPVGHTYLKGTCSSITAPPPVTPPEEEPGVPFEWCKAQLDDYPYYVSSKIKLNTENYTSLVESDIWPFDYHVFVDFKNNKIKIKELVGFITRTRESKDGYITRYSPNDGVLSLKAKAVNSDCTVKCFSQLLGLVRNKNSLEIHMNNCTWASKTKAENRESIENEEELETLLQENYDGCYYCLEHLHKK